MPKPVPNISFFFRNAEGLLPAAKDDLIVSLPTALESNGAAHTVSYKDYFDFIAETIRNNWAGLTEIAARRHRNNGAVKSVQVISEKHGADYHPALINLVGANGATSLVANVAITERGLARLADEFRVLKQLASIEAGRHIPEVYFLAENDDKSMGLFVGEWLKDFHEFHLSSANENQTLVLWENSRSRELSMDQSLQIYERAAAILTDFYDIHDCSEIYPWHHAAGDFVAQTCPDLSVKLITVRQFATRLLLDSDSGDPRSLGLLLFFANLTIRMRLDRVDGVGDMVWANEDYLRAAVTGFLDSMESKSINNNPCAEVFAAFRTHAKDFGPVEWAELFQDMLSSYDASAPDIPLIIQNCADHVWSVYKIVQENFSD
jgi:hypothetical protein